MRYNNLVQFTPIEEIIQLRDSGQAAKAASLVETYVMSDLMASKLVERAIPQIQIDRPGEHKGVLVVGNYGTGKSHLMSVLAAVCEHAELADSITHPQVRTAAASIAGKFKVLRVEIGSVRRDLRDILLDELSIALGRWGTPVAFPPADQVNNNKNLIIDALGAFQQKYPGMGILMVVDELLDHLRTREHRALILDLGFLRELGEVAAACPFRFVAGLQETLFENPSFSFVAEQLRRVKDRFEQINIVREDITFVVSKRLLKKTDQQKAWITEYLRRFAPLYKSMAERLDDFINLFPIHPVYVEVFETLIIAEKRHVLKTFSAAIRATLDLDVPEAEPGLISYDHYWKFIQEDASLRSMDDVARVIDKSAVLEGLIRNAYTRPNLQPMALRIIRALSVQRLATSDIFAPLGVTAESLRDGLCLFLRLPAEMSPSARAEFLLDQVRVALNEILRTVQGQFITFNAENGQYYLDLKKVVDFDQKIHDRGESMDRPDLNEYFYDALRQALNLSDTTYLTGHSIWFYELPWADHKVTRPGYLFFGPPDERTTAQPPRDFYVYILPPFMDRPWQDEKFSDEVIFYLHGLDQGFERLVRQYAGARAMARDSTEYRQEYANKADEALRSLNRWLREQISQKLHIVYQGVDESVQTTLSQLRSTASQTIEDLIRLLAAHLLAPEFSEKYPDYPRFTRLPAPVTENSRSNSAMEGIRALAGRARTNLASAVLEGLGLLDTQGVLKPQESPYARHFFDVLTSRPEGQVVNRGEVIEQIAGGVLPVEKDLYYRLEPEWVVVILLALVYNGDIVFNLDGREEMDAASLERALTCSMQNLVDFRFYKRPRGLPLEQWRQIFEGLGLQPGLIRDENGRPEAVTRLGECVRAELENLVQLHDNLQRGLTLWNLPVFTDRFTMVSEGGVVVSSDLPEVTLSVTELLAGVRGYKGFLEDLSKFNTVGKLRNLHLSSGDIAIAMDHRKIVERARQLVSAVQVIQPGAAYLAEAMANLPDDHPWITQARQAQKALLDRVRSFGKGHGLLDPAAEGRELNLLKQAYITAYTDLHHKQRLSASVDDQRQRLYRDARLRSLKDLAGIDLLGRGAELAGWNNQITSLVTCREFHEGVLADAPTCPYCHLRPSQAAGITNADQTIRILDERLSEMLHNWRQALHANLESPTAQNSLAAMSPAERRPVEAFLAQTEDEAPAPDGFVQAASQAFHGIEAVTLPVEALIEAIKNGGLPCTRDEFLARIRAFLDHQMRGHDVFNTRLSLDQ